MARYVPVGDEWEDDAWRYPESVFEKDFLKACKRKYYPTKAVEKKVKAIEKMMLSDPPKFPHNYVYGILAWATKINTPRVTRDAARVISAIRNPENLDRFYKEHPDEQIVTRNYDTDVPDDW